jgi:hypothetical protein
MAIWTTPTIHATGDILSVSDWNGVANNSVFLYQAPYGLYWNYTSTSLATTAWTQVGLTAVEASDYGMSLTSNNAVVPLTGIYQVAFGVGLATGTTQMTASIYQNGAITRYGTESGGAYAPSSSGASLVSCNAGDTIGLWAYQQSGGAVNTNNLSTVSFLQVAFVGSA